MKPNSACLNFGEASSVSPSRLFSQPATASFTSVVERGIGDDEFFMRFTLKHKTST